MKNPAALVMDEKRIKTLVLLELARLHRVSRNCTIAAEYSLQRLGVRSDLAILSKKFIGVEIKSELDNTSRLDRQLDAYLKVFDATILVLATKHISYIENAPRSIEIWEICGNGAFKVLQRPERKAQKTMCDSYARFLTKEEIRRFVANRPDSELGCRCRNAFEKAFNSKYGSTSKNFWSTAGTESDGKEIYLLSRYKPDREKTQTRLELQHRLWNDWLQELCIVAEENVAQSLQLSSVS